MEEITTTNIEGKTFMGEVNMSRENKEEEDKDQISEDADFSDIDSVKGDKNINAPAFSIEFAIPPEDWEAPYASLPSNIKLSLVKMKVAEAKALEAS